MTPETAWTEAMKFENRADPYRFFDELRKTPVAKVADDIYVVTTYREAVALAHDPRVSSDLRVKARNACPVAAPEAAPEVDAAASAAASDDPTDVYTKVPNMLTADPPDHDRMRRLAGRHFTGPHSPGVVPALEPICRRVVNASLDKAKAEAKTRLDMVDDFAYPLPVAVICDLLGVPLEDEKLFHGWIADFFDGALEMGPERDTPEGQVRLARGRQAGGELRQYLIGLIERYAREPADCMLSKMVHDDGPEGRMSPGELVANAQILLVAGHDSTVNHIAHCILVALRNPGSLERLRARPELIPGAVEEVMRLQSSVQFIPTRNATSDIEIAGTVIPKGASIYIMWGAANRDPERFPDPTKFDPEREDNEHLGFGSGIHTCFGGPLPRLEVNIAFEIFIRRVENPRLVVDPPPYRRNQIFRGPRHLLVDIDGIRD